METQKTTKNRKPVVIALILLAVISVLTAVLLIVLTHLPEPEMPAPVYHFYPVNRGENIMSNSEYLALDRSISYCADPDGYGVTEEITDESRAGMDPQVRFLESFLRSVIDGDSDAYRAFFREDLIAKKQVPIGFTQQMLYRMTIRFVAEMEPGEGEVSRRLYRLDYYIHRNNGTFRSDMESDVTRPQFTVVSEQPDGSFRIENLYVNTGYTK